MNGKTIAYWISTALFALPLGASGVMYLSGGMTEQLAGIGYPEHFVYLLGVWKVLGVLALLVPRFPLLKEWAYAGFFFNLTGASVAHAAFGDVGGAVPPLVLLGILGVSYFTRPAHLRVIVPEASGDAGLQPATA